MQEWNVSSQDFQEKEKILKCLKKEFEIDPTQGIADSTIAESLNLDAGMTTAHMAYLEGKGYLKVWERAGEIVWYIITTKGIDASKMEYSTQYQTQLQKHNHEVVIRKQSEKTERAITEERRHQEMVQVAKDANKWTKKGMIIAILLGGAGLLIAIFKP